MQSRTQRCGDAENNSLQSVGAQAFTIDGQRQVIEETLCCVTYQDPDARVTEFCSIALVEIGFKHYPKDQLRMHLHTGEYIVAVANQPSIYPPDRVSVLVTV